MIVVRLWGGLGNQMFQYAFGYAMAKKNNTELILDTRFFTQEYLADNPHFSKQKLNIMKFPIDYRKTINEDASLKIINCFQKRNFSRIIRIPSSFKFPADQGLMYVKETRLNFLPKVYELSCNNFYFDGYWQTEKYFKEYKHELVRQFSRHSIVVAEYVKENRLREQNTVAIHMRMGDYALKKQKLAHYNYVINPQYYKDAIKRIKGMVDNPKFFICSNNIEKACKLLGDAPEFTYVNKDRVMSDLDEFEIMSMCKHQIISNSTFSWWAAWLSKYENGIKIAPNIIFGNEKIIPEEWIKIDVIE